MGQESVQAPLSPRTKRLLFVGAVAAVAGVGFASEALADQVELDGGDHADLVDAHRDLVAPDVDPHKVQDFVRLGAAVDRALSDIDRLIANYRSVSGPTDAPLRILHEYREQFVSTQQALSTMTPRVAELQSQFSPYHTTTSALRMAKELTLPDPATFSKTYALLDRFYTNLSPGEFVLAKSDMLAKDWISSHVPFKDVSPAPTNTIEYLGHVPEKPALIPPRLGFQLDRAIASLPEEVRELKVTAGNGEAPKEEVHLSKSCHYQTPLKCVDLAFISKTQDPHAIGKVLAGLNTHAEVARVNYEVLSLSERDRLRAIIGPVYGSDVAERVTYNSKATNVHFHFVAK